MRRTEGICRQQARVWPRLQLDGNHHKHDGQSSGAPADVAQRRDPARGPPPRGPKRFRGEADPGLVTLVRWVQAGIALGLLLSACAMMLVTR